MRMLQQFFAWLSLAFGYVKENATKILLIIFIIYIAGLAIEGAVILTSYILEKRKNVPGDQKVQAVVEEKPAWKRPDEHWFVERTSPRLQALRQLNDAATKAQFHNGLVVNFPADPEQIETTTESKYYFDHFDFKQGIIYAMKRALKDPESLVYTKKSLEIERQYLEDLKKLPPFMTAAEKEKIEDSEWLSFTEYAEIEKRLYKEWCKAGTCDWEIKFFVKYKPQYGPGNIKVKCFSKKEIIPIWDGALKSIESNEYQRMLVTPSIRYQVMKQDNFRCQICGRTAKDGVKLHVDHIRPVSKGGSLGKIAGGRKYDNLRTLCDMCNTGKSDFYEPNGLN